MSDFSSKVLTQSETIESVFATTQQSTVHLERGQNELKVPPPRCACAREDFFRWATVGLVFE